MWTTQHTADTTASPAAVWAALKALHSGTPIGENSDHFDLHGEFAVGTTISVTPRGQETFQSRIVELRENEVYADRTTFGDLTLLFRHTLTPRPEGGTTITHQLVIDGAGADDVAPELGPQISGDFPVAMQELVEAARRYELEASPR
ncbi:polyketide cyclase [Modestobacter sp. I12A-02628]|uniref:Polyketide cyclase n=1 Tax=Goekera deserti TaxID=2497753 RepID=A0A7K3WF82_9ACTN|nr:polyketide cyclase [Goekera deserti]MPQ97195.1 polyketide cyclase [Goekera deserti]NDI46487.1 polyketide cyclase [Goekera deserti]NEL54579.1 polyketide cyclase [Goekera deserti]